MASATQVAGVNFFAALTPTTGVVADKKGTFDASKGLAAATIFCERQRAAERQFFKNAKFHDIEKFGKRVFGKTSIA